MKMMRVRSATRYLKVIDIEYVNLRVLREQSHCPQHRRRVVVQRAGHSKPYDTARAHNHNLLLRLRLLLS